MPWRIAVRIISGYYKLPMASTPVQAEMLRGRLVKRRRHLGKWARRNGIDAYRLYDRDIPEVPLLIDWYAGAVSLSLYERPYEKDHAEEAAWLSAMKEAASEALEIPGEMIFCRERKRLRGRGSGKPENAGPGTAAETETARYSKLADTRFERIVHEGDLMYKVNLSDYLDTGLFLDRRRLRALIRSEAAGKRVLNLFCYTASLSAASAAGGAKAVDSVDLSAPYLEWARSNFRLNGLLPAKRQDTEAERFRFIRADVLSFLEEAQKTRQRWDLIILDPPAFSNSKKMNGDLDLKRDHPALVRRCLDLLGTGPNTPGILYFNANVKGFKLDREAIASFVPETKPGMAGNLLVGDISEELRDEDFRGKRIPACFKIARQRPPTMIETTGRR
jgi:23S rRNA G2069 N7-methylase RlmK/C1962 C5-methylase RlmI